MEIRDPVHGSVRILDEEIAIIESPFFKRLRNIKQLGFTENIFPGATHTRYLHSIGVMDVATKVFNQVFRGKKFDSDIKRLKETVRLASLLHDIGHAPLSHTSECAMPDVFSLNLGAIFSPRSNRQATHEDYTIKSIIDSELTGSFRGVEEKFGILPEKIAELIVGETTDPAYFIHKGVNYFPLMHQLVSSEMDCDRMDYLLRDSYFCGVSYGKFDLDWIVDNLRIGVVDSDAYLGISERAVSTFDDFLLSRYHMFLMVYFHYKSVCLEKMLQRYFESKPSEYTIPSCIDEYLKHDDHYLMKVLRESSNKWAIDIVNNSIPAKVFETFGLSQLKQLETLESFLGLEDIDFIKCSSSGRLSKYYLGGEDMTNKYPLKVIRESSISKKVLGIYNINQATNLFEKFSQSHTVNRIHCDYDSLNKSQQLEILKILKD